jgi:hypothetical protein
VKNLKRTLILVLAVSLIIAGVAMATVVSTKHDMRAIVTGIDGRSITATGSLTTQVCVFCHHPHRGTSTLAGSVLLWNINDNAQTYATYSSPTTNATDIGGNVGTDDAAKYTLLCMGCHDGGGASNTFIRSAADGALGTAPDLLTGNTNLGSTLEDDHPVDFVYPSTAIAADGLTDIKIAAGGQVVGNVGSTTYPLYIGTMQCATCHNVHNGDSSGVQFMRGNNIIANSEICRDCHA